MRIATIGASPVDPAIGAAIVGDLVEVDERSSPRSGVTRLKRVVLIVRRATVLETEANADTAADTRPIREDQVEIVVPMPSAGHREARGRPTLFSTRCRTA